MLDDKPVAALKAHTGETLKQKALWYLAKREHSRSELAQKLGRKSPTYQAPTSALIEAVLDVCEANAWLSDSRYAEAIVRSQEHKASRQLIAAKLRQKGVDADTIAAALPPSDEEHTLATAQALWSKKFGTAPANDKEKARQMRFLMSRGFGPGVVYQVVKGVESEEL